MDDTNRRIKDRLTNYPNLSGLLADHIPVNPPMEASIYKEVDVERVWGKRYTIWNVLVHDEDRQLNELLRELDSFAGIYASAYGEDRLRSGMKNDPFSFLSELIAYDSFRSHGISPEIEPSAGTGSSKRMDLSIKLDGREILLEIIKPFPPGKLVVQGSGFAPLDFGLAEKLAGEVWLHLDITREPANPFMILLDGLYSALDPFIASNSIDRLNRLKASDLSKLTPDQAELLANRAKLFISAVLLFRSNWGSSLSINPSGPSLTGKELSTLRRVFQISN